MTGTFDAVGMLRSLGVWSLDDIDIEFGGIELEECLALLEWCIARAMNRTC